MPHRIELNLREIGQLFNTMDPAPFPERDLEPFLNQVEKVIQSNIKVMPSHQEFIDRFCRAKAA